jgi:catechol-2,3-dioxygenase
MGDGSFLACFQAPDRPFDFKERHDYDLHIALDVDQETLHDMFAKGKAQGTETRDISDHGFVQSIYFRDPNGYVIELAVRTDTDDASPVEAKSAARVDLATTLRL